MYSPARRTGGMARLDDDIIYVIPRCVGHDTESDGYQLS